MSDMTATGCEKRHEAQAGCAISAACIDAFCRTIARRTGIVIQSHQIPNLRDTLQSGCERFGFESCAEYFNHVDFAPELTPALEYLVAGITVGESYFFRDSEQIKLLRTQLLPGIIADKRRRGDLSLRIWSAGCSHGQEIYSVAMLLCELLPDLPNWHVHLLGTDINTHVLTQAVRGRYSEWSFRAMTPEQKSRWFTRIENEYELESQVRKLVHFSYLNLTEDDFPSIQGGTNALDLILCRNVFIYLDREVIRRTMGRFADCLVEGGTLMLGASDPVDVSVGSLTWHQTNLTAYFCKQLPSAPVEQTVRPLRPDVAAPPTPAPGRVSKATLKSVPVRHVAEATLHEPAPSSLTANLQAVAGCMQQDDWAGGVAAVEAIEQRGGANSVLLQMKAQCLASLGRMDEAQQACVNSLEMDPDNAHAYLVRSLVLAELDREPEAEEALNRALYLNHEFVEAHYDLGMLKIRSGRVASGIKSLENALRLARKNDPNRQFHNARGMTYSRFVQVLTSEIEVYRNVGSPSGRSRAVHRA